MRKNKSLLISFEGIEGSGKSTQCRKLTVFLKKKGWKVSVVREPGSSTLGETLRDILLHGGERLDPLSETLLFIAARAHLVREKLRQLAGERDIIIIDRYIDATLAYQGYGSGVDRELIGRLNQAAVEEMRPAITLLLDLPAETGIQRCSGKDRFESRRLEFHDKVRKGYLDLARQEPRRIKVLSSLDPVETVQNKIRLLIEGKLKNRVPGGV